MKQNQKQELTVINVGLPEDVLADLDAVIKITGRTASEIISKELERYFALFKSYSDPDYDKIHPRPAMHIHGVTPKEWKCAEVRESPCYVLSERTIYGSIYYKIWDPEQGNFMSVPDYCIRFPKEGEHGTEDNSQSA